MADKSTYVYGINAGTGNVLNMTNSSVNLNSFKQMQIMIHKSIEAGRLFNTELVSTYSLIHTGSLCYIGGILAPNGDIHFIPYNAPVGQKININGNVSTYSLVYTTGGGYHGGVLAPNGDIHFIPYYAKVGQKVDINGNVSTYSLVYTTSGAYFGGVLAPNGDIHFIPCQAAVGQKITTLCAKPFDIGLCLSPFFNKF